MKSMITEIAPRYWGPNVVISGNGYLLSGQTPLERAAAVKRADEYQREVQDLLRTIEVGNKTETGKQLLKAVNQSTGGKTLRIVPLRGDGQNALTFPRNPQRGLAPGVTYWDPRTQSTQTSKGGGTDAVIAFEPRNFMAGNCFRSMLPTRQLRQDDVLVHELVHALRSMCGLASNLSLAPGPDRPGFDNVEEFYAILLTNIYVSECGRGLEAIRVDHQARFDSILSSRAFPKKDAQSYYDTYRDVILKLVDQMDDLTRPIGLHTDIAWNPLETYYIRPGFARSVTDTADIVSPQTRKSPP